MKELLQQILGFIVITLIVVGPYLYPKPQDVQAATVLVFLTTTGTNTWTVPDDWNSSFNTIEVIGGGGGAPGSATSGGGGGGGGGYSTISSLSLTAGNSVTYRVGAGGAANGNNAGGDTFFNRTAGSANTCADTVSVCAKGGGGGVPGLFGAGGTGGAAGSGVGTTKYSGGNGASDSSGCTDGGGGGAAGPKGAGANGAQDSSCVGAAGGAAGNGQGGSGGTAGNTGGAGKEWDTTHGSGGGGGSVFSTGGNGGNGGLYGGGAGSVRVTGTGGAGAQGLIVITYQTTAGSKSSGLVLGSNTKFSSTLSVTGALSKGSGSFLIDHPLDPSNKFLFHSFVESPEAKNIYDGIAILDENGSATIRLPSYFDALNGEVRYQFSPLGQAMPNLHIGAIESVNKFTIVGGTPGGKISWQVTGVRHDPYILKHPIPNEVPKGPDEPVNKGECLYEPLCK